ncbi:MAG: biotin carboxylase N-terminal domain-containing protein [Pseudomonadota bacterium]
MIRRLLIANRGEIACRIIGTCQRLGVETVAVYSEADAGARFVRLADRAIAIGAAEPQASYLNAAAIVAAACDSGADAVHPGYGFLSENPELVQSLTDAGIIFVGPRPKTIEQMGSKATAKALMAAAGVPVVPGYHGEDQSDEVLRSAAEHVGFPLMLKAAAGGGGKGMRIVREASDFAAALASARRESTGAFGDDRMILERYIERPRHLEVQVFGDQSGNVVHLFERDCSAQRRFQKVLEECPAPGMSLAQRQALWAAGVDAAKAVDYLGAGTVEFIADPGGEFYFMEMNTRLQVEHPVTEAVTGLDLVEWQLLVASGEDLPLPQDAISCTGHALEARLYAEDPDQQFLPDAGTLTRVHFPAGVRADTGVESGDQVTVHYDPMIAKLICHEKDRPACLASMRRALAATVLDGLKNNVSFLYRLLASDTFAQGQMHTALLDSTPLPPVASEVQAQATALAALALWLSAEPTAATHDPFSPWAGGSAWRMQGEGHHPLELTYRGEVIPVRLSVTPDQIEVTVADGKGRVFGSPTLAQGGLRWSNAGQQTKVPLWQHEGMLNVALDGALLSFRLATAAHAAAASADTASPHVLAPMPGKIVSVAVAEGDAVEAGAAVLVMEAMKMELTLSAPQTGLVAAVRVAPGDFVDADAQLLEFKDP